MTRNTFVSLAVAGGLLAAAVALGHWREPLVAAAALPMLVLLRRRRRPAPLQGPDAPFIQGCLLYAVLAVALSGWDLLVQVRLGELVSPLAAFASEGREALKGWLAARGHDIYPGADPPWPRLITLYPPLYYLTAAALWPVAGSVLLAGRLAALAGGAAILAALCAMGRRMDGKAAGPLGGWLIGLLAALAAFAQPEMGNAFVCKPDTLAVGGLLLAVAAFEAARRRGDRRYFAASGLLMALACLAKQQIWPLAGAYAALLFVFDLSRRERLYALAGLAGGGAVLGLAGLAWFGQELWVQTVLFPKAMAALADENSPALALARLRDFAAGHGPLLAAYAGWLALCAVRRRLPLADALLLAFIPFLWRTLMWSGADANHLLLPTTTAALGAARLAGYLAGRGPVARGLAALALAGCLPAGITLHAPSAAAFAPRQPAAAEAEAARNLVSGLDGPVLTDAEGAFLFAETPGYGKLWIYDAFETAVYDRLGLAPMADSPMAAAVRGRLAARFADSGAFVSPKLLNLVGLFYEPAEIAGPYTFYRPRSETGLIAMPAVDQAQRVDGGYTAALAEVRGLRQWGSSYIQAEDPALGMELAYAVAGPAMAAGSVSYCPRLTGPDQTVVVTAVGADGRELGRAVHRQGDFPARGEGFDNRVRLTFPVGGQGFVVRFATAGGAQLWLDADNPLVLGATAAGTGE
jgi:hypothetical protein